jgi:hypothetical protein
MREIKFRAWDNDYNRIFNVVELSYEGDATFAWREPYKNEQVNWSKSGLEVGKECNLMQYAGLKDLWEGDIVSDNVGTGWVEYISTKAAFRVNYGDGRCKWFIDYLESELDSIERLGNTYENQELLSA